MKQSKRSIKVFPTNKILELSKFATPKTSTEFIHFDKLSDGTWRLLFNVADIDIKDIESLIIHRED